MRERYEFFDFGSTESELEVSEILINLPALYLQSNPSQLRSESNDPPEIIWANRKRRSVLNNPPSPPLRRHSPPRIKKEKTSVEVKEKENPTNVEAGSPATPLGFYPATAQLISKKKKSSDKKKWEEEVNRLENLRDQLKLSSDRVKDFNSSILNYNLKLNAKRIQIYDEIKNRGIDLNKKVEPQYPFPLFACQQQQLPLQQTSLRYLSLFPTNPDPTASAASSGGGMRMLNQQNVEENCTMEARRRFDMDDKSFRAADARKRRMIKINEKKNCGVVEK